MLNVMVKQMKTDSGNPQFVFFEEGNISRPFFILSEFEMAKFKYFVNAQSENIPQWRGD